MQDAYVVDQNRIGTFTEIGYEIPTSSVVTYNATDYSWHATASSLNKCGASGGEWGIDASVAGGGAKYEIKKDCPTLTPNFKYIGSSKAAS